MKKIPGAVVLASTFCLGCLIYAAFLELEGIPALVSVGQLIAILGILAVTNETFRWGSKEGYVIRGQSLSIQIERVLRCASMTVIVLIPTFLVAGLTIEVLFQKFWR